MADQKPVIYKLKGNIKKYDWGGTQFIADLIAQPNPGNEPMAEYWLGAHDAASSKIITDNKEVSLARFIANDKDFSLGKIVARKFGSLPYLLKVLDVRTMLSIQVHPAKHEAEIEFARENKEGIPLTAPNRNYKDDNHKPELMVALSDFWALHGFKPVDELKNILETVAELKPLLTIFESSGYDQLYKTAMEMPQESVNQLLEPLLKRIIPLYENDQLNKEQEDFWAARAAVTFGKKDKIDRGIFSVYFFNLLHLKPGEGIFQDAGLPHAYLEGQNVELMANSDNVLRGGLTTKHIDVKELMKHVRFEETKPNILHAEKTGGKEKFYRTGVPDFKLTRFELNARDVSSFDSVAGEILLVRTGHVLMRSGTQEIEVKRGEAVFIVANAPVSLKAMAESDIYRASVPVHGE